MRGSIHYAIQQPSPSARLHCIHQGFYTSPQLGQVAWVAKQPDSAAESNSSQNID
jgi:hypothetical protein